MSRLRVLLVSMLGLVVLSAVASSAASAQPTAKCEPNGNTTHTLSMACVQNTAGELLVLGLPSLETILVLSKKEAGTVAVLKAASGLEITCTAATNEGLLDGSPTESASQIELIVTFTGCTPAAPEHCALENGTIKTELLTATSEIPNVTDGLLLFKPAVGTSFARFTIINSGGTCGVAAELNVTGEVLGNLLKSEEDLEIHLLEFNKATGLLVAGGASEFTLTEEVELDTPGPWTGFPAHPLWGVFLTATIS